MRLPIICALAVVLLSGCSFAREAFRVNPYSAPERELTTAQKLDAQLGIMTFEVALQWFGPPANCAEAGATKTCIWADGPDGVVSSTFGSRYGYNLYGQTTSARVQEGPRAQLAFTNDRLVNWKLTGRWQ